MPSYQELLNLIWKRFRIRGVTDNLVIIEHIAAILIDIEELAPDKTELKPIFRKSNLAESNEYERIKDALSTSLKTRKEKAIFFNNHVLFNLNSMLAGGRYPTPRHIVEFVHCITEIGTGHSIADFSCGSGGFLASRPIPSGKDGYNTIGIEISPEWARIAWTNCALHDIDNGLVIDVGNSLLSFSPNGPFHSKSFDRILMNPSFGETIDSYVAREITGVDCGSRSEIAMTFLALNKLSKNGIAAIMVPSGRLFTGAGGRELRRIIVEEYHLEAVIGLPSDGLQPFSTLQTNIFVIKKENHQTTGGTTTWFFRAEKDGYPTGRGRDLTRPPQIEHSDLPLIAAAIISYRKERYRKIDDSPFKIKHIKTDEGKVQGYFLGSQETSSLKRVEFFEHGYFTNPEDEQTETPLLLLTISLIDKYATHYMCIEPNNGKVYSGDKRENIIKQIRKNLKYKPSDPEPGKVLIREEITINAIAIDRKGRFIGALIPNTALEKCDFDLRPEYFVKVVEETPPTESPALLLASIRKRQSELLERVDNLMGRIETVPISSATIPPLVFERLDSFGKLNDAQSALLDCIMTKYAWTENVNRNDPKSHFSAEDVEANTDGKVSKWTRMTLDLFEKMGLIVPVSVKYGTGDEMIPCYRIASEWENWTYKDDNNVEEDMI